MPKYMFSNEFLLNVVEFYKNHTEYETSIKFNISKKVIERIIKNAGTEKHKPWLKKIINEEEKKFILNNYEILSDTAIARELHIHIPHLLEIYKELDLKPRTHEENVKLGQILQQKTCLEKYGFPFHAQSENIKLKIKTTNNLKTKEEKEKSREKTKSTCLKKYGCEYVLQSKEVRDKTKQTNIEKYGVDCYMKTLDFKEKGKKHLIEHKEEIVNKRQKTCLKKYGCIHPSQIEEVKEKIRINSYNVRKKNKTLNTSQIEENFYENLLKIFNKKDIFRQYKESRYPFSCDFYIKSLDLFIELNFHWSHGMMPFDENNEKCINKIKKWKLKKESTFYKEAIKTWTERDVKKLQTAKQNNLNYFAIYSYKEIENCLEKLKLLKKEKIKL